VIADVPAALGKLNDFLQRIGRYDEISISISISAALDPRCKAAYEAVMTLMPIAESIARAAQPGVEHEFFSDRLFTVWQCT